MPLVHAEIGVEVVAGSASSSTSTVRTTTRPPRWRGSTVGADSYDVTATLDALGGLMALDRAA
ncbi:MAG: hypothetical protein M3071_05815 [Actinomycetota bacterium]|nr:hypothetical protein [Actinomycetota bacterium]